MQMLEIYEYIGPNKNSQNLQTGDSVLCIGFCEGEWELSKTNWYDVKENQDEVRELYNNLLVDFSVSPENFEKYFRFSCEISQ